MEIRVVLDAVEPPSGHLCVLRDSGGPEQHPETLAFQGWLGLLRALWEVIVREVGQ